MFFLKDDRMTSYSIKLDSFPLDTSGTRPAICGMLKPLTWDCTTTPPWGGNSYEDSQAELEWGRGDRVQQVQQYREEARVYRYRLQGPYPACSL